MVVIMVLGPFRAGVVRWGFARFGSTRPSKNVGCVRLFEQDGQRCEDRALTER